MEETESKEEWSGEPGRARGNSKATTVVTVVAFLGALWVGVGSVQGFLIEDQSSVTVGLTINFAALLIGVLVAYIAAKEGVRLTYIGGALVMGFGLGLVVGGLYVAQGGATGFTYNVELGLFIPLSVLSYRRTRQRKKSEARTGDGVAAG